MRAGSDVRRSVVAAAVSAAMVLLVAFPAVSIAVEDGADDDAAPEGNLPDGDWLGSYDAQGTYTGSFDGSQAEIDVIIRGGVGFASQAGALDGEWSHWALGLLAMQTPGGPGSGIFVTQAEGAVDGHGRTVRMTGEQVTTGHVIAAGRVFEVGPNVHAAGPLEVELTFEGCNLVVGDWIAPLTSLMDTGTLTGSLEGSFAASYQGELDSDLLARFQQLRLDLNAWERDLLETDVLVADQIFGLLRRILDMEYEVRGVGEACEFGPDGDRDDFTRFLTAAMRDLTWLTLTRGQPAAQHLDEFITVLLDFGIVGSGSQNQGTAAEFAEVIGDHVDRILAAEVVVQTEGEHPTAGIDCSTAAPCLALNPEARQALRAASRLGLDVEIAGSQSSAREILDRLESLQAEQEEG